MDSNADIINTMFGGCNLLHISLSIMFKDYIPETIDKNVKEIKKMIDDGGDVHIPDEEGMTAIMYIIVLFGRSSNITKYLVGDVKSHRCEHIPDPTISVDTLVYAHIEDGSMDDESVGIYLQYIDKMFNPDNIKHQRIRCLKRLIEKGYNTDTKLEVYPGYTPSLLEFIQEIWSNNPEMIAYLLE